MTTDATWQERNQAYLTAALAWLRARIDARLAAPAVAVAEAPPIEPQTGFPLATLWRRPVAPAAPAAPIALLAAPGGTGALDRAASALEDATRGDPAPALLDLARRLDLTPFERNVLLLAIARELDPALVAMPGRTPSFALAMTLFDDAAWEAMAPDRALRHWRLIHFAGDDGMSKVAAPIVADERIVSHAKGLFHLDDTLAPWVTPMPAMPAKTLPASQRNAAEALMQVAMRGGMATITGTGTADKRAVAGAAAADAGVALYRLAPEALALDIERIDLLARLWHRETLLAPLALLIEAEAASDMSPLRRFVGRTGGCVFVSTREAMPLDFGTNPVIAAAPPEPGERKAAWQKALGAKRATIATRLADQFVLDAGTIASLAAASAGGNDGALWDAARIAARPVVSSLAQRIDAKARRDDLVLPDAGMALIDAMIAQVGNRARVYDDWGFRDRMNRGFGITALFAGPSGTGKTMAAEVVANALALDLYRIDLAAVVSKYIGETEKNLRDVFDALEGSGAVLLFDEADALFGKRSEVKDSHDRYANIEIDYLLQRLEGYSGVAILATNLRNAIDAAFLRRLRFIVEFPYPDAAQRRRIWERALPATAPSEGLDLDRLAQLDLSGGDIHAVALGASFAAAAAGSPVTMPLLLDAARRELRKLDRPVNEAELRPVRIAGRGR